MMRSQLQGSLLALLLGLSTPLMAQPAGGGPPKDVFVEASLSADGIVLSPQEVTLSRGDYYRLNFTCTASDEGEPEFNFAADPLVRNSHLRILTVDTVEVHLQGLSFRALQCEGAGSVKFSFHPLRAGAYDIEVSNEDTVSTLSVIVE